MPTDGDSLDPTVGPVEPEPDVAQSTASSIPAETQGLASSGTRWARRKFLAAAALGAAALAVATGDKGLLPDLAFANDLSTDSCTAQDVTVLGVGQVVNYCACSSSQTTFNALVNFTVQNTASADRCCIALHLVAGTINGKVVVAAQDVLLKNITSGTDFGTTCVPGKSTVTMQGTIAGFPCDATGVVTFGSGSCGTITTGKCTAGACSTIGWDTNTGSANCTSPDLTPPPGQCRHETICVQGFGATLACTSTNCTPECGGSVTLQLCGVGGSGKFSFALTDSNGQTYTASSQTATCATFNVTVTGPLTFTGTVTDTTAGCSRTATLPINVTPFPAPTLQITAGPDCSGNTTIAVTNASSYPSGVTYTWTDTNGGTTTTLSGTGSTITAQLPVGANTIGVTVSNGVAACAQSATINATVNAPVATSLTVAGTSNCNGQLTFTASATGGNGTYTFAWAIDGNAVANNSTNTLLYQNIDGQCHKVSVTATDTSANLCKGNTVTAGLVQCAHTAVTTDGSCPATP